jgi:hypothetical protein
MGKKLPKPSESEIGATNTPPSGKAKTGRGHPPVDHQWKPGQSGNKKGRKKKSEDCGSGRSAPIAHGSESRPPAKNVDRRNRNAQF